MIMNIRENDFRGFDLNLLVTLAVLLRERSVSRAAQCLYLGQPAVSGALARLRSVFDDDLFVRSKSGMLPTPRAIEIQAALAPALEQIRELVAGQPIFVPASAAQTFVVGLPDWVDTWLLSPLLARLNRAAPGIRLTVVATDPFRVSDMLAREEMDLAIGSFDAGPAWQRLQPLRSVRFCCVFRADVRPAASKSVTLRQYTELPHLLVSYRGSFQGAVDDQLAKLGESRNVAYSSPRFSSLPRVLQQVPAIATVPDVLAPIWQKDYGLRSAPLPFAMPAFSVGIAYHARRENDSALQWLRDQIGAIVAAEGGSAVQAEAASIVNRAGGRRSRAVRVASR